MNGTGGARPDYLAAVGASLCAEALYLALGSAVHVLRGHGPWGPVRKPASFVLGPEAMQPHGFAFGDVLLGFLVHVWLSVLVGLIYAAILPRLGVSPVAGGLIAAAILLVLGHAVLSGVFPAWLSPYRLSPSGWVVEAGTHLVYGVTFGRLYARLHGAEMHRSGMDSGWSVA